jgi:hypothetical protein
MNTIQSLIKNYEQKIRLLESDLNTKPLAKLIREQEAGFYKTFIEDLMNVDIKLSYQTLTNSTTGYSIADLENEVIERGIDVSTVDMDTLHMLANSGNYPTWVELTKGLDEILG